MRGPDEIRWKDDESFRDDYSRLTGYLFPPARPKVNGSPRGFEGMSPEEEMSRWMYMVDVLGRLYPQYEVNVSKLRMRFHKIYIPYSDSLVNTGGWTRTAAGPIEDFTRAGLIDENWRG